jgi:hypothetical protein
MKTALYIALGGLAAIALALALYLRISSPVPSPTPAPEPRRTTAAMPHPAKLQHVIAQQSNEIRRLKKEKSALMSELEHQVTELAKPEPRPARAGEPAASPRPAGMGKMVAVAVRQQAEMKMAALKSRLRLTDEQAAAVRELLMKQADQQAEMASRMFEGKLTAEDMKSRPTLDFEGQLKQVLSAEQWTGYQEYKTEERRQQIQMASQSEMMQLSPLLQLSAEQQQQVSGILQQQYQQMIAPQADATMPTPGNFQRMDQMLDAKKEALRAVLTPEQMQSYEKFVESQREMIKSMIPQSQAAP